MKRLLALMSLALFAAVPAAHASSVKLVDITNDYQDTGLYFWADGAGAVSFDKFTLQTPALSGWKASVNDGTQLFLSGPVVAPGAGRVRLRLNYSTTPFSFQWAEVYFDGTKNLLRSGGTLTWERVGSSLQWVASSTFTHLEDLNPGLVSPKAAAVPLPASVLFMLSGLVPSLLRRRARA